MRLRASPRGWLWAVAILLLGSVGGCTAYLADEGDPSAPVLVQGRVVDASGGAMSGATVHLTAWGDSSNAAVGEPLPSVYDGDFRAGLDGTFTIRLAPTPAITALAAQNGGYVNFGLVVFAGQPTPWAFPRELRDGTWAGEVPTFEFGPNGVTGDGGGPAVPAPGPEGS